MYRILLKIGFLKIYSYGVFVSLAFLISMLYFLHLAGKRKLPEAEIVSLSFWMLVSGLAGARAFYVIHYSEYFFHYPLESVKVWQGGLVFYGGLVFALIVGLYLTHQFSLPFFEIADLTAPSLSLGIAIGRIGCFLNGCCYGWPSRIGFVFPPGSPAGDSFPGEKLIPTQLISSLDLFIIFLILRKLRKKINRTGQIFFLFLVLYALHRFLIEFLRADYPRIFLNMTEPQFISLGLGIFSLNVLYLRKRKKKKILPNGEMK